MPVFEEKKSPYDLTNLSILIAEDSNYMLSLMSNMLKIFGVGDVMAAEGGREASDILTVTQARTKSRYIRQVDIVLVDWLMPKGSGRDFLKWIRNHDSDTVRFIPVVVVSGYTTELVTAQARDLGANEVLVKPVSATGLASRICAVIDHPRPFIKSHNYFGPDRRRTEGPYRGPERRVMEAEKIEVQHVTQ